MPSNAPYGWRWSLVQRALHQREDLLDQNRQQLLNMGQQKINNRRHIPASEMASSGICSVTKTPLVFLGQNVKMKSTGAMGDAKFRPSWNHASAVRRTHAIRQFSNRRL